MDPELFTPYYECPVNFPSAAVYDHTLALTQFSSDVPRLDYVTTASDCGPCFARVR
jgi:hypothetical protein